MSGAILYNLEFAKKELQALYLKCFHCLWPEKSFGKLQDTIFIITSFLKILLYLNILLGSN